MSLQSFLQYNTLNFTSDGITSTVKMTASAGSLTFYGTTGTDPVLLSNVASPVTNFDAVNKLYVDSIAASGITWKNAAQAATTGSVDLTSTGIGSTVDGVVLESGDRILVKNQNGTTANTANGLYVIGAGAWTRSTDAGTSVQASGNAIFITAGTANGQKSWVCTTTGAGPNFNPVNYGTAIAWILMSSSTSAGGSNTQIQYNDSGNFGGMLQWTTADAGITLSGSALAVLNNAGATTLVNVTATNLDVTGSTVLANVTATNLDVTGSLRATSGTVTNLTTTNITTSGLNATNSVITAETVAGLVATTGITTAGLNVTGSTVISGVTVTNLNVTNVVVTAETVSGLVVTTGITSAGLNVTGSTVLAGVTATQLNVTNVIATSETVAGLVVTTGITTAFLTATNSVITNETVSNLVATNSVITNETVAGLVVTTGLSAQNIQRPTIGSTSTLWTTGTGSVIIASSASSLDLAVNASVVNLAGSTSTSASTTNIASASDSAVQTTAVGAWTPSNMASTSSWSTVCFSNALGLYVALGTTGNTGSNIAYSTNGTTWTLGASANTNPWTSVCYSPQLSVFAAVSRSAAATGAVMTSASGTAGWIGRTAAAASTWNSVCASPAGFLAVGRNTTVATNVMFTTAVTNAWTAVTASAGTENWTSVCYAPGIKQYAAVASTGPTSHQLMVSNSNLVAGMTWTRITTPSNRAWSSICWSPMLGLYAAVATDGTVNTQIMTGDGGTSPWISRTCAATRAWTSVCWSDPLDLFVAVANDGSSTTGNVMSSPDGIVWTQRTSYATNSWTSVCSGDSLKQIVAVSGVTGSAFSTSNGMYSVTPSVGYNNALTLGTLGTSSVRVKGSDVVIYNVPYYYAESRLSFRATTTPNFSTDSVVVYKVPPGIYMCTIWFQNMLRGSATATDTYDIQVVGSDQGTIMLLTGNTVSTTTATNTTSSGTKIFNFVISLSVLQNIFYQIRLSAVATGDTFSAGTLRTMFLQRIG